MPNGRSPELGGSQSVVSRFIVKIINGQWRTRTLSIIIAYRSDIVGQEHKLDGCGHVQPLMNLVNIDRGQPKDPVDKWSLAYHIT